MGRPTRDRLCIFLITLNPNKTRGFFRPFHAIGAQKVEFETATGKKIGKVLALRSGRTLPFKQIEPCPSSKLMGLCV